MCEKSQPEGYMTKDEDKQRSVLILYAFIITACQQKQFKWGVDLHVTRKKKEMIRETGIKEKQLHYYCDEKPVEGEANMISATVWVFEHFPPDE